MLVGTDTMTPSNGDFEVVEDRTWWQRHPGAAMSALVGALAVLQLASGVWIDERQRPQWEKMDRAMSKMARNDRNMARFQLETSRYNNTKLDMIADSANIKMPPRPKELDIAEAHVRKIQEGD